MKETGMLRWVFGNPEIAILGYTTDKWGVTYTLECRCGHAWDQFIGVNQRCVYCEVCKETEATWYMLYCWRNRKREN